MKKHWNQKEKNPNWRGGLSEYPNHYLMKKHRLIILMNNPKCEICGKNATEIHHRNKNKSDHRLKNLMAICSKCHIGKFHNQKRLTKYYKKYGLRLYELAKKYNLSSSAIWYRIKYNIPFETPKSIIVGKYGMTLQNLGSKYNLSYGGVYRRIKLGIPLDLPKHSFKQKRIKQK